MALPTLDRAGCGGLPPDHSVEDHLAAERVALQADLRAAEAKAARDERWRLIRAAGLGLALAGTIAFGWSRIRPEPEPARFCNADGYVTADGTELHRDQDCRWVGPDGKPVPVDAEGRPTG
ncbi:MAG TPA: hypothetical protein VNS19_02165 [Acidimicrobiales bacterium]|nr:hypothetical protein [Acidimicrobiales bacterium]